MEISHENASGTSGNKSENKSNNSKTKKGKGSSKSKQKDSNLSSSSTSSKGSTLESKKSNPNLSSRLGKDGKLTPQERQCRLNKNLCLFCSASGHMAKDCPKSTSAAAKAHTASTTPAPESTSTPKPSESKKRLSNPWDYARPEDCAELPCAKIVTLGTSALYDQDSLILLLTSDLIPDMILTSLVDAGSSDSFLHSDFVQTQVALGVPQNTND